MGEKLPTADEFFGAPPAAAQPGAAPADAGPKPLPTADEFFSQKAAGPAPGTVYTGQASEEAMSQTTAGAELMKAPILHIFGAGAAEGWGDQPFMGWSDELKKEADKLGIYDDLKRGQVDVGRSIIRSIIMPSISGVATGIEAGVRGLGAVMGGTAAVIAAGGKAVEDTAVGRALNLGAAARELAGLAHGEIIPRGTAHPNMRPTAGAIAEARAGMFPERRVGNTPLEPGELADAGKLKIMGGDESTWEGTSTPSPEADARQASAIKDMEGRQAALEPYGPPEPPAAAPAGPAPDIHAVARQIDPQTFGQYDALAQRRETFNRWIEELGDQRAQRPEVVAAQARIDDILGKVGGVEEKLTKAAAGRLEAARADLDRLTTGDTADMARVRADLQKTDFAMRDLAPQVSAAYRAAQERAGAALEPAGTGEARPAEPAAPGEPAAAEAPAPAEAGAEPGAEQTAAPPRANLRGAWFAVGEDRDLLHDRLTHILERKGSVSVDDIPAEMRNKIDTGSLGAIRKALAENPRAALDDLLPSPASGAPVTFTTAKGSTYEVHADGTTTRNKSFHPEHGEADQGPQPRSQATVFVSAADADKLGEVQAQGYAGRMIVAPIGDGRWGVKYVGGPHDGKFEARTVVTPSTVPEKGMTPVETFANGSVHFGNEITEVSGGAAPAEAPRASNEGGKINIADRVAADLVKAGRPAEEAAAAAQIVTAYHETRAARLGITPEQSYAEAQPGVRQGRRGVTMKGHIDWDANGRAMITLLKNADASTFMHEGAHGWLEQLWEDALDPRARPDVRADAEIAARWMGIEFGGEDQVIPTKAHERFARGFERYLTEGVAPSEGLARVFAQFKEWMANLLTKLNIATDYRTGLRGSKINDDIRGVYDRLLSQPDKPTVIAPERETPKALADHHEDAAARAADITTEPAATAAADKIRAEADAEAAKHPEIADELGPRPAEPGAPGEPARPAGEAGRGPAAPEPADRHGDAGQPDAGAARDGAGPGAIGARGDEAAPAGGGTATRERPVSGPGAKLEPPAGAGERFAPQSDYLKDAAAGPEMAGNIRLDKFNQPADFDRFMQDVADRNANFIVERRGVLSEAEQLALGEAMGVDPAWLDGKKIGEAFNTEQTRAINRMLVDSYTEIKNLAPLAKGGDAEAIGALAAAIERHRMIQGKAAQARAEWGRAGQALNAVMEGSREAADLSAFLKENTGRTLFQMQEMAAAIERLQTPGQVGSFLHQTGWERAKSQIIYYYTNALISGPLTHARYAIGNAITALFRPLVTAPIAATIGSIEEAMAGRKIDRTEWAEIPAQFMALGVGSRNGLRAAYEALKTGDQRVLPGQEQTRFTHSVSPIPGIVGTALGLPGRSVSAIHSFFATLRYEQNIAGLAVREAMMERAGMRERLPEYRDLLTDDAFQSRVGELTMRPSEAMMQDATKDALKELYMAPNEFGSAAYHLTQVTNNWLPAKIAIPFVKIGTQITSMAAAHSPIAAMTPSFYAELSKGGADRQMALAKVTAGTALIGATVMATLEGMATGDGPTDPKERAVWMLNHKPNSITIGNVTVPYQGLGHLGMLMRFSANMTETAEQWDDKDGSTLAVAFLEGITKGVLDENWMRGAKDMLDAIYHPKEYGENYLRQFAANWLPFSVGLGQVAREIDPYHRIAHTVFDAARSRVPVVREGLMPQRDVFGVEIPNGAPLPDYADDRVVLGLERLHTGISKLPDKIRGVQLTPEQYDRYAALAGQLTHLQLSGIMTPDFEMLPKGVQMHTIDKVIGHSREIARKVTMAENPLIIRTAIEGKRAELTAGKKHGPFMQAEADEAGQSDQQTAQAE